MTEKEVKEELAKVKHPEIDASLLDLGMIKKINVEGKKVSIRMAFPFPGVPIKDALIESVKGPLEKMGLHAEIEESVMNQEELQKFFKMEQEKWRS